MSTVQKGKHITERMDMVGKTIASAVKVDDIIMIIRFTDGDYVRLQAVQHNDWDGGGSAELEMYADLTEPEEVAIGFLSQEEHEKRIRLNQERMEKIYLAKQAEQERREYERLKRKYEG